MLRASVAAVFERYQDCRRQFEALQEAAQNRDARLDLLRYQVRELKNEVTTVAAIEDRSTEPAARTVEVAEADSNADSDADSAVRWRAGCCAARAHRREFGLCRTRLWLAD